MKKYLFILLPLCFWGLLFSACQSDDESSPALEDDYKPMLVTGRTWNISCGRYNEYVRRGQYTMTVGGDTTVYGIQCKKITKEWKNGTTLCFAYETNRCVYRVQKNIQNNEIETTLLFDFNVQVGDSLSHEGGYNWYCQNIDTIEVNGEKYRRFMIGWKQNDLTMNPLTSNQDNTYWIEGIGTCNRGWYLNSPDGTGGLAISGRFLTDDFLSCYDGEKCLFEWADFWKEPTTTKVSYR